MLDYSTISGETSCGASGHIGSLIGENQQQYFDNISSSSMSGGGRQRRRSRSSTRSRARARATAVNRYKTKSKTQSSSRGGSGLRARATAANRYKTKSKTQSSSRGGSGFLDGFVVPASLYAINKYMKRKSGTHTHKKHNYRHSRKMKGGIFII